MDGYEATGAAVGRFCSAKSGIFSVSVPPGRYVIVADAKTPWFQPPNRPVYVHRDAYTIQNVFYDNGGA